MTRDLRDRLRESEPTRLAPPDLERIRQRGRRRRLAARTTATVGAVAVVALAVGGVTRLVAPSATVEPVAPTVEESPTQGASAMSTAALAAELGMQVMRIAWSPDAFTGFSVEQTAPDGSTATAVWDLGPGPGGVPVVTSAGQLWTLRGDGSTVRYDPSTGDQVTPATSDDGLGWLPLASTADGDVLVTAIELDPDRGRPEPSMLGRLAVDGDRTSVPGVARAIEPDEVIGLAAASPHGVALGVFAEQSSRVVILREGEEPVTALEIDGTDSRIVDVAFVADELWTVEIDPGDGTATLHRFGLDGTPTDVTPLDLDGVIAWRMTVAPDASHVAIPVGPRASTPISYVIEVDAVRGGSLPADSARRLDEPGVIQLLPPRD